MKKIDIAIQQFQLEEFIKTTIAGNENICSRSVFTFKNPNKIEHENGDEQRPVEEVLEKFLAGEYLYANFSNCGIDHPRVYCIDGGEYLLLDDEAAEEYFEYEDEYEDEKPEGFVCTNGIYLDEYSSLGYLLKLEKDVVTIQAVRYSLAMNGFVGPCGIDSTEGVEMLEDTGVFDEPMREYVKGFIK